MKSAAFATAFFVLAILATSSRAIAQNGSIEFVARATPSGGLEEPVRGFPFYLLSKSYEDIGKEVDAAYPPPDKNAFIDKLDVSKELKEWMKKNHWISLSGEDFTHKLKVDDIMNVPEFFKAYMDRNAGDQSAGFPKSKAKLSDKVKDPAKFDKLTTEYMDAIRRYITQNPMSIEGIDLELADTNPGPKWDALVGRRVSEIRRQIPHLAQSKYLVARTVTNLDGQGFLRGIPAGTYWLSTLDVAAVVGDARLRWDVAVTLRPDETAHVALSNVNAVLPSPPAAPFGSGTGGGVGPEQGWDTGGGPPSAGIDGYGYAACLYCPPAEFSDEAVKAKYEGVVTLMAIITPDGKASDMHILKRLGMGLDQKAIEAVQHWRFKAALGPDGRPAAVRQIIEVKFHPY